MTILTLIGVVTFTLATAVFFCIGRVIQPPTPAAAALWVSADAIALWLGIFIAWVGIWAGREKFTEDQPSRNSALGILITLVGTCLGVWLGGPIILQQAQGMSSSVRLTPKQTEQFAKIKKMIPRPAFLKGAMEGLPGGAPAAYQPVDAASRMNFPGRTPLTQNYIQLGTKELWPAIIESFKKDQPVYYKEDKPTRMNLALVAPIVGQAYEKTGELKKAAYYYAVGATVLAETFPGSAGIQPNLEKALHLDPTSAFVQKVRQTINPNSQWP
jgi:hypothetical protein